MLRSLFRASAPWIALLAICPCVASADGAGYAIELDGISGYLGCDLPPAVRAGNAVTLAAWILRAGPRGDVISPEPRGQAAVGLGFHLGLSGGKVFCAKGNGSGTYVVLIGNTAVPIGTWHHIAATFDGSTMRVYLDAMLDGALADGSIVAWADLPPVFPPGQDNYPAPAQVYLGATKLNLIGPGPTIPNDNWFEGCVDEAQIWNRALSAFEIDMFRRGSLTGSELGLVGYWKFDEGTGTMTADASVHGGDLTLHGGATWKVSTAPVNVTGVGTPDGPEPSTRLAAFPNPTTAGATILLAPSTSQVARVSIFDTDGRRIRDLWAGSTPARGELSLRWDGRDQAGRIARSGVYLVRLDGSRTRAALRLLVLR